jgi:hypothetical protein
MVPVVATTEPVSLATVPSSVVTVAATRTVAEVLG